MTADEQERCVQQKIAVVINACDVAAKHYDDYYKGFVALDGKARGIATISGLVLAAVAAFLKDGRVPVLAQRGSLWTALILAVPLLALAAVIASLWGARVTEVVRPFDAPSRILEAEDLVKLSCDQLSSGHILNYYSAQLAHWRGCLQSSESRVATGEPVEKIVGIAESVEKKAARVLLAQRLMLAALALLTLLFAVILFASRSVAPAS
jgi:hypothetical protein